MFLLFMERHFQSSFVVCLSPLIIGVNKMKQTTDFNNLKQAQEWFEFNRSLIENLYPKKKK